MIEVDELTKVYRVPKKTPGLWGSLRAVFRRRYDEVRAVDGVSFRIDAGERVGFLGPNGAGKTTTLKMLAGLLVPTSGNVKVAGFVPSERRAAYLSRITLVMGQKQQLLWDLPPTETFELNRAVFGIDRATFRKTLDELVGLLEIGSLLDRPVRNLSLGERMKCELAAALLHRPEVLFLDEPTIGLDVTMQAVVRRFIARWNEQTGATVLLTSHYMADIAALCARVVVVSQGRVSYDGALDELVRRYAPDRRVIVQSTREPTAEELQEAAPFRLREGALEALVPSREVKDVVDRALRTLPVRDLTIEEPRLEDVIARLFEDSVAPVEREAKEPSA
ncbi:MAG: ATP-binding cassette domain-containing protein [Deltaproteobacteria bacterium]|nr:ATP-binding cassette domain-containing protein [Deltaproteobacteria bacterium]